MVLRTKIESFNKTFLSALIAPRNTDSAVVAQDDVTSIEVNFANKGHIAGCIGKAASTAAQMRCVFCYSQQSRTDVRAVEGGRVDVQGFPILRNPVMLHVDRSESCIRADDPDTYCSLQIAVRNSQGCEASVNLAEAGDIGQNGASNIKAMWIGRKPGCRKQSKG